MLLDGFDLKIQKVPYFDQSVAYVRLGGASRGGMKNSSIRKQPAAIPKSP